MSITPTQNIDIVKVKRPDGRTAVAVNHKGTLVGPAIWKLYGGCAAVSAVSALVVKVL